MTRFVSFAVPPGGHTSRSSSRRPRAALLRVLAGERPARAGDHGEERGRVRRGAVLWDLAGLCGGWWFDDLKRGAFGPLQAVRRDTEMCGCLDGRPVYTQVAVQIPQPEAKCACTRASIDALPAGFEAYPVDVALARLTDQDQLLVRMKRPAYRQIGRLARGQPEAHGDS